MINRLVLVRLITLTLIALFSFNPAVCQAQLQSDLEFQISSDKSTYIPGEPIIVTSVVTNKSSKTLTVKEPTALGFVSAFTLETGQGEKKQVFYHGVGFGRPVFWAADVKLQPTQSVTNSCELSWQIKDELLEGKYLLRARYNLSDFGAPDFATNVIEAKPIEFEIVQASEKEKLIRASLSAAIENPSNQAKKAALKEFLTQYPNSVYRVTALDELRRAESKDKNVAGKIEVYRQLLKEKISSSKREHTSFFAADASAELGDIKGALDFLKEPTLPNSLLLKSELEERADKQK